MNERQLTIIYSALDVEYVRMMLKTVAVAKDDDKYHEAREDLREMKELMTIIDQMTDVPYHKGYEDEKGD